MVGHSGRHAYLIEDKVHFGIMLDLCPGKMLQSTVFVGPGLF